MKTIRVTVPKTGKKWKVSFNGVTPYARLTSITLYNFIERKILSSLASWTKEKTKIHVNYDQVHVGEGKGWVNEGIYTDPHEVLYVLACFLEDYISPDFALSKYKKYYPEFTGEKYGH